MGRAAPADFLNDDMDRKRGRGEQQAGFPQSSGNQKLGNGETRVFGKQVRYMVRGHVQF